jgi:hypothetical protein
MTSEYRDATRRVVAESHADPTGARRALRELLFALLDSDSEERAEMFSLLTLTSKRRLDTFGTRYPRWRVSILTGSHRRHSLIP